MGIEFTVDAGGKAGEERMPQAPAARPRTRWAAILWGLAMAAIAAAGLWIVLDPQRLDGFADWLVGLTPLAVAAYAILAIGGLLLIAGLAGLARRAQRRLAARSEPDNGE